MSRVCPVHGFAHRATVCTSTATYCECGVRLTFRHGRWVRRRTRHHFNRQEA